MNIFSSLREYAGKWNLKDSRKFTSDELAAVASAVVVSSAFGNSVCFHMKSGGMTFMPLSNDSTLGVGDSVNLEKAEILTLSKQGESDINRIRA